MCSFLAESNSDESAKQYPSRCKATDRGHHSTSLRPQKERSTVWRHAKPDTANIISPLRGHERKDTLSETCEACAYQLPAVGHKRKEAIIPIGLARAALCRALLSSIKLSSCSGFRHSEAGPFCAELPLRRFSEAGCPRLPGLGTSASKPSSSSMLLTADWTFGDERPEKLGICSSPETISSDFVINVHCYLNSRR